MRDWSHAVQIDIFKGQECPFSSVAQQSLQPILHADLSHSGEPIHEEDAVEVIDLVLECS
jgi:hypothetical protein